MPEEVNTISINISENNFKKSIYKKPAIILGIILFVILLIGSAIFILNKPGSYINPSNNESAQTNNQNSDQQETKMFENPINGELFTYEEASKFKDIKPIAVMVNNYVEARPSAGITSADIVYEAVAESGITRLMPLFWSRIPEKVSSIRSARYYFVELAAPYHPHYIHWGAAHVPPCQKESPSSASYCPPVGGKVETIPKVDAYDRIVKLGLPNLDGGNYSCDTESCAFGRDPQKLGKVALEHTAFVRLPLVYDLAKKIRPQEDWHKFTNFTSWKFKEDALQNERGEIGMIGKSPITYNYWDTPAGFDVKWEYDKESNTYLRYQGGTRIVDAIDNSEVKAKTVIIRFTKQELANDKKNHLLHEIVGNGDALIFMDGKVIEAKWSRTTHEEMDQYVDKTTNEPLLFNRGQIWVQLVPTGNKINYQTETSVE